MEGRESTTSPGHIPVSHGDHKVVEIPNTVSYPTGSLEFLHELTGRSSATEAAWQSKVRLHIIVAGAGLGGLSAAIALVRKGHKVTVFEQADALGEVGAGIQIPPNSSRHLIAWGLEPYMLEKVVEPSSIKFRRWQNGDTIAYTKLVPEFRQRFDAPYWVVHRADFHEALYRLAMKLGVEVQVGSRVEQYEAEKGRIVLENGETHDADLVIAADGIKSAARKAILGGVDKPPVRTGFAAYRATIDTNDMRRDPDTARLLENPGLNLWIGDMRHVMTYTISAGKSFNMVFSHPDDTDPSTWDRATALQDMRRQFENWDPTLTKLIGMVKTTLRWPLISGSRLERWVHPSNKLCILGDAAHAMVPYMSQGAAIAVEDGASLAAALALVSSPAQLPDALKVWEAVRIERSAQMQEASLVNGKLWHFADGPEQRARDAATSAEVEGREFETSPNQWSDPVTQRWCYGYDAVEAVKLVWSATGRQASMHAKSSFPGLSPAEMNGVWSMFVD